MMNFLLDVGISPKVLSLLTSLGHRGVHCTDIDLASASDHQILDYAIQDNSIVITSDLGFGTLAVFEERVVPGVIILRLNNPNAAQMVASLRQLLTGVNAEQIHQAITVVEPHRIRITKLPIG